MRTAILTTALVIAALFYWSSVRERADGAVQHAAPTPASLPDVAAAPAVPGVRGEDALAAVYETATSAPAREHVVAAGETLATLAERYYGDAARADQIYRANRDRIRDPEQLHAGQTLVIP